MNLIVSFDTFLCRLIIQFFKRFLLSFICYFEVILADDSLLLLGFRVAVICFLFLLHSIGFCCIRFYSILFYSFYSILFYSILFYSILFYSIVFYSILFYSILFYSILFYSILFYSSIFLKSTFNKPNLISLSSPLSFSLSAFFRGLAIDNLGFSPPKETERES